MGAPPILSGTVDAAVEFHRGGPDQRLITLRLTPRSTKLALDVTASLGGDLR